MKRTLILAFLVLFVFPEMNCQVTFSVKPGINLNGASIGYSFGKVVPYVGLQYYCIATKYSSLFGVDTTETKIRSNVFMPFAGVKYAVFQEEKLSAFIGLSLFKPFVFGRAVDNGVVDPTPMEAIGQIGVFGAELGFSAEYYFDQHFSLGGEFGYRYGKLKVSEEDIARDNYSLQKYVLNTTYTSLSLNFYF